MNHNSSTHVFQFSSRSVILKKILIMLAPYDHSNVFVLFFLSFSMISLMSPTPPFFSVSLDTSKKSDGSIINGFPDWAFYTIIGVSAGILLFICCCGCMCVCRNQCDVLSNKPTVSQIVCCCASLLSMNDKHIRQWWVPGRDNTSSFSL